MKLVRALPDAKKPIWGLASLDDELYVHADKELRVYETSKFTLQRAVTVPGLGSVRDMAACAHQNCVYVVDDGRNLVHRVEKSGGVSKWPTGDKPQSISVTSSGIL